MNSKASPPSTNPTKKCRALFPYFPSLESRLAGEHTERGYPMSFSAFSSTSPSPGEQEHSPCLMTWWKLDQGSFSCVLISIRQVVSSDPTETASLGFLFQLSLIQTASLSLSSFCQCWKPVSISLIQNFCQCLQLIQERVFLCNLSIHKPTVECTWIQLQ
jgi:hypothetical protein